MYDRIVKRITHSGLNRDILGYLAIRDDKAVEQILSALNDRLNIVIQAESKVDQSTNKVEFDSSEQEIKDYIRDLAAAMRDEYGACIDYENLSPSDKTSLLTSISEEKATLESSKSKLILYKTLGAKKFIKKLDEEFQYKATQIILGIVVFFSIIIVGIKVYNDVSNDRENEVSNTTEEE